MKDFVDPITAFASRIILHDLTIQVFTKLSTSNDYQHSCLLITMKNLFSTAAFAVAIAALGSPANAQYFGSVDEAHNFGEERGSFDLIMKPYPIPVETTTYTDFFFNLPDDLPETFHVTFGEVINSQPQHLHHFVITGCPKMIDPSLEGVASEYDMMSVECLIPVGGWAPGGDVFGNIDLDTGILLGKGLGIQALQLNVHYTDGVYEDEAQKIFKMATDGIRVHYTPDFRPYSSVFKELINVGTAPKQLTIPPGESRFFLSRNCKVDTKCKDVDQKTLMTMAYVMGLGEADIESALGDSEISCESLQPLCNIGGEIGSSILQLCPATCGLCEKGTDGAINPLNPDTYRVTAIHYHAHLLGREMYTTLIRDEEVPSPESGVAVQKEARAMNPVAKDLESREFWIFDNQEMIPLELDVIQSDTIMRGMEIKAGDQIHATCVYDSTYRDEPTQFFLSTYDEMCITNIRITFETPDSLLNGGANSTTAAIDLLTEINLRSFSCGDDEQGDVYSGILGADEDGRDIWKDHPVDQAEGCTYITMDSFFGYLTEETRNCDPVDFAGDALICDLGEELLLVQAGATCIGGTLDQQDANMGITAEECKAGGGVFQPYTCGGIQSWLPTQSDMDAETVEYMIDAWWKPKCCGEPSTEDESASKDELTLASSAPGGRFAPIVLSAVSASAVLFAVL
jgi:hypothetical protein